MYHFPIGLEDRAMARAVPGAVGVVPGDRAALVGAGGGDGIEHTGVVAPHGELFAVAGHDGAFAAGDGLEVVGLWRRAVAARVEILRHRASGVEQPRPGPASGGDLPGDAQARRGAIADAPGVETGGHEVAGRLFRVRLA